MDTITVGTRLRFSHPTPSGATVRFTATVRKIQGDFAWVEMPAAVRRIPFAPLGGKRYGKYLIAGLLKTVR